MHDMPHGADGENILSLPGEIADYPSSTGAIDVQVVVKEAAVGYATATVPVSLKKRKKKKKKKAKKNKK